MVQVTWGGNAAAATIHHGERRCNDPVPLANHSCEARMASRRRPREPLSRACKTTIHQKQDGPSELMARPDLTRQRNRSPMPNHDYPTPANAFDPDYLNHLAQHDDPVTADDFIAIQE